MNDQLTVDNSPLAANAVPALRFPEFSGAWCTESLEEKTTKISDGIHSTPVYDALGDYYFVNGNNLINGKGISIVGSKKVSKEQWEKHKRPLNTNTILLSINGTIGNVSYYENEKIVLGKSACYINVNERLEKTFLFQMLQTIKIQRYFLSELTGTTIMNLSLKTIKYTRINSPELKEQQKIAAFLTSVDTKIEQLGKKKFLLEKYKKGMMQKLFSQAFRFKDELGNGFPDWEEKRLKDVLKIGSGRDYKNLATGKIPVYGTGGYMTSVDKYLHDGESVCIGRKGTIDKPIYLNEKFWTVDTLFFTHSFTLSVPKFIYAVFQTINWKKHNEASGVPSLSKATIEKIKIDIPSMPEQQKIANFLTTLDNKIDLITTELNQAKTFKKGLLQQMFV